MSTNSCRSGPRKFRRESRAFTLVELLVVMAIIGVLVAFLLPAVQQSRESARRTGCINNTRQVGLGIEGYRETSKFYPASNTDSVMNWKYSLDQPNYSWMSAILPFVEEQSLASSIVKEVGALHAPNQTAAATSLSLYLCPSYPGPRFTDDTSNFPNRPLAIGNFVALGASDVDHLCDTNPSRPPEGVIYPQSKVSVEELTDGLSKTALIAETREERIRVWIDGRSAALTVLKYDSFVVRAISLNTSPYYDDKIVVCLYGPSSLHPGGANHAFADGSVRFVRDSISVDSYIAMMDRAGGKVGSDPQ